MDAIAEQPAQAERLRVHRDLAAMVRRVQALPPGDHALIIAIDDAGRVTWRYAALGGVESKSN